MNPVLWTSQVHPAVSTRRLRGDVPSVSTGGMRSYARTATDAVQASADVFSVADLSVLFPGHPSFHRVVDGVSFSLRKGEMLGIVGESGSGKTLTAMAIAQLVPYPGVVEGSVNLLGTELYSSPPKAVADVLARSLAIVFQDPMSSLNPALRIGIQLTEAVEELRGVNRSKALAMAIGHLREVQISTPEAQLARYSHELSGGMRQRVMIAMGLMNEPSVLIADEPTTALDVTIQAQIMEVLNQINTLQGTSIILISHNLGVVRQNCHRVLVMYAGRIVEDLPTAMLLSQSLHPYTRALLAAVPDMKRSRDTPLEDIPGQVPDVGNLPIGCAYHPRCPLVEDRCRIEVPPLLARPERRRVACWVANRDPSDS